MKSRIFFVEINTPIHYPDQLIRRYLYILTDFSFFSIYFVN